MVDLLEHWVEQEADGGRVYYWNTETDETSWNRPVAIASSFSTPSTARPRPRSAKVAGELDGLRSLRRASSIDATIFRGQLTEVMQKGQPPKCNVCRCTINRALACMDAGTGETLCPVHYRERHFRRVLEQRKQDRWQSPAVRKDEEAPTPRAPLADLTDQLPGPSATPMTTARPSGPSASRPPQHASIEEVGATDDEDDRQVLQPPAPPLQLQQPPRQPWVRWAGWLAAQGAARRLLVRAGEWHDTSQTRRALLTLRHHHHQSMAMLMLRANRMRLGRSFGALLAHALWLAFRDAQAHNHHLNGRRRLVMRALRRRAASVRRVATVDRWRIVRRRVAALAVMRWNATLRLLRADAWRRHLVRVRLRTLRARCAAHAQWRSDRMAAAVRHRLWSLTRSLRMWMGTARVAALGRVETSIAARLHHRQRLRGGFATLVRQTAAEKARREASAIACVAREITRDASGAATASTSSADEAGYGGCEGGSGSGGGSGREGSGREGGRGDGGGGDGGEILPPPAVATHARLVATEVRLEAAESRAAEAESRAAEAESRAAEAESRASELEASLVATRALLDEARNSAEVSASSFRRERDTLLSKLGVAMEELVRLKHPAVQLRSVNGPESSAGGAPHHHRSELTQAALSRHSTLQLPQGTPCGPGPSIPRRRRVIRILEENLPRIESLT
jgi:uncharacterized membrane protein YgcG